MFFFFFFCHQQIRIFRRRQKLFAKTIARTVSRRRAQKRTFCFNLNFFFRLHIARSHDESDGTTVRAPKSRRVPEKMCFFLNLF